MNRVRLVILLLVGMLGGAAVGHAQYFGVGLGRSFGDDLSAAATAVPSALDPFSAGIRKGNVLTLEGGGDFLRVMRAGVHYGYSRPEGFLSRGDAFGSSADLELTAHTLTFDLGLHTPQAKGFRLFGVVGGGVGNFKVVEVVRQVENPFPSGPPDQIVVPVVALGGGIEHQFLAGVRWKVEVRDEYTRAPEDFFQPGGSWHRILLSVGLTFGK
ncbi:MAG: hypothetical protein EXQ56_09520 [Acidobacteria bacterium]|nr:hypothetical protein [Acidobacteriota bacterium]